ncbi:unnamed protein product [Lactuca virosa]|uniref:BHLH domain-containing protein n=1 Tax=Lactuca virosa TaxID=75947 RepID=A0AAU9MIZ3_9ASTR|nr:unnamed protein product [Lactuca virosa]
MESVISLLGDWNSFNGGNITEEAYFMAQLLDNFPLPYDPQNASSPLWPHLSLDGVDETWVYLSDDTNSSLHYPSQNHNSSYGSRDLFPTLSDPTKDNELSASSMKRSSSMADVFENKDKIKCRKSKKLVSTSNEDVDISGQFMKIYRADEDPKEAEILSSNSKTKASRGSATDPQSVYARKRRERINERLRILQNLVPNGTKVDISTMLEEAVEYVKFLQLQIKLLSSDDLWMYAPIAYNGMDIGLHSTTIPSSSPR